MIYQLNAYFNATSEVDTFNATHDVKRALRDSKATAGIMTVFVPGSTACVTILENDPAIWDSVKEAVISQTEAPQGPRPSRRSGSGHTESHIRAAFFGPSVTIPIQDGKLLLSAWQDVIVFDFDDKGGRREVLIHIMGEAPKK